MKRLWNKLVYIDALCGSGKCVAGSDEFDGSPLIALGIRPAFDHLYLSDRSSHNISALKKRISKPDYPRVSCKVGDCNTVVDEVIGNFPERSLGLAFVDPEGCEVDFAVLKALAGRPNRRVVLLSEHDRGQKKSAAVVCAKSGPSRCCFGI